MKKVKSGLEFIDSRQGGFVAGKSYLVYGEPGTGKTVFGLQFLNQGLLQGERCGLVTQEDPKDLLTMGRQLGFHWEEYLKSNRLILLRYLPDFPLYFTKSFDLVEVFNELRQLSGEGEFHRLVFDPITPIVDCVNRLNYTKVFTGLFNILHEMGSTAVLTLDELSGVDSSAFLRTLISLSFGVIQLKISSDLVRKMFFQKMKFQVSHLHPEAYSIEPQMGIISLRSNQENGEDSNKGARKKILIADGDVKTCEEIQEGLGEMFEFSVVHDGIEALTRIVGNSIDLIIIEATLPKINGFEICRRIRSQGSSIPIFFISGKRRKTTDKIRGLDLGGDDYLLKPLNLMELRSRVVAVLRRGKDWDSKGHLSQRGFENGAPGSHLKRTAKKNMQAPLTRDVFISRVEREIEKSPSNPFTLVGYQFKGVDEKERKKLIRISSGTLNSLIRGDDFVGNLGYGRIGIFLQGANGEYSNFFRNRVRRRIRKEIREKMEDSTPSFRIRTGSAVFPEEGKDARTIMTKAFRSPRSKGGG